MQSKAVWRGYISPTGGSRTSATTAPAANGDTYLCHLSSLRLINRSPSMENNLISVALWLWTHKLKWGGSGAWDLRRQMTGTYSVPRSRYFVHTPYAWTEYLNFALSQLRSPNTPTSNA